MRHWRGDCLLRLLDRSRADFSLDTLGFSPKLNEQWRRSIRRSSGMVLVTGPTGSGKTTTLYGSISAIRSPELKFITIEDPIEYEVAGVNQIQVQTAIGLSFASGLRSVLRHDPDVILIGENSRSGNRYQCGASQRSRGIWCSVPFIPNMRHPP